jgi:hypothetical protein
MRGYVRKRTTTVTSKKKKNNLRNDNNSSNKKAAATIIATSLTVGFAILDFEQQHSPQIYRSSWKENQ